MAGHTHRHRQDVQRVKHVQSQKSVCKYFEHIVFGGASDQVLILSVPAYKEYYL